MINHHNGHRVNVFDTDTRQFHAAPIGPYVARCTCGYASEVVDEIDDAEAAAHGHFYATHALPGIGDPVTGYLSKGSNLTDTGKVMDHIRDEHGAIVGLVVLMWSAGTVRYALTDTHWWTVPSKDGGR